MAKSQQSKKTKETTELPLPNPYGLGTRLAISLLPILVIFFVRRIGLPGVDIGGLGQRGTIAYERVSIIALGITPILTAALLVEVVTALVPKWQHLRHGGMEGRAKLQRSADILTLILAVFQSYSLATFLQGYATFNHAGYGLMLMLMVTMTAGTMALKLLADFVSTRGLVNGYGLFMGASTILDLADDLISRRLFVTPLQVALFVVKIGVIAALTWFFLRPHKAVLRGGAPVSTSSDDNNAKNAGGEENPYAAPNTQSSLVDESQEARSSSPLVLPGPAAGIVPYSTVLSILAIPATLATWLPESLIVRWLLDNRIQVFGKVILVLALTSIVAELFQQPRRVAQLYARLGGQKEARSELEAEARNALGHARMYAIAFIFGLFIIDGAINQYARMEFVTTTGVVVLTALVLDFLSAYKAAASRADFVAIWPEHRPYALAAARHALEREGIQVHIRDERQRTILQFGAGYLPMTICVPQTDAEKAQKIIEKLLLAKADETAKLADVYAPNADRQYAPPRGGVVAGIIALAIACVYFSIPDYFFERPKPARIANLEFVLVDDDHSINDEVTDTFPGRENEIRFEKEQVSVGPGKLAIREYAVVEMMNGETLEAARQRMNRWLAQIKLPEGSRVALGEYQPYDQDSKELKTLGWRTYLLKGDAIIKNVDVREAQAIPTPKEEVPGWLVRLSFTAEAAKRFEQVTGDNIKRRFAILLDGLVKSAPVIQSKIPGGVATITMGNSNLEQQERDARNLELVLNTP